MSLTVVKKWILDNGLSGIRKKGKPPAVKEKKPDKKPDPKPVIPRHNADRHLCKTCQYRGDGLHGIGCDYCYHEGHSRGCSVEDCNVYVKGSRLKTNRKTMKVKKEKQIE